MPKIRATKPEFWTDEKTVSVSPLARLLFMGMWNYACDNGHLDDSPIQLKMRILPADNCDVSNLLAELVSAGLIVRRDGFVKIVNLTKHQNLDRRYLVFCDHCDHDGQCTFTREDKTTRTSGKTVKQDPESSPSRRVPDGNVPPAAASLDGRTAGPPREPHGHPSEARRHGDGDGDGDGEVTTSCRKSDPKATPTPEPRPSTNPHPQPSRPELAPVVDELCDHLADRIATNGTSRPTVTRKWRDACRLMLERDQRTPDQVRNAIDWCQTDEFWRANILSMPKLRSKFDQLRLHAQRANSPPDRRKPGTDDRVRGHLDLAARLAAQEARTDQHRQEITR